MTIIRFPGGPRRGDDDEVERASALKRRLVDFVTRGPLREAHAREMQETGIHEPEFHEYVDFTDWFVFEWESDEGVRVLDEFLASETDLSEADRRMLESWYDAIDDVFQVVSVSPEGVTLRDGDGETYFAVPTGMSGSELGWNPKTLVHTRLIPVGNVYMLSGIQSFYDGSDLESLPTSADLTDIADAALDDADDGPFAVADVRTLPATQRPEGSVAAAAYVYLDETSGAIKSETAEGHAFALSMLAHYALRQSIPAAELSAEDVIDFLAAWYPPLARDRSLGATRALLASIGKFATWLSRKVGTDVGAEYRQRVLPVLKEDLPRTVKAAAELDRLAMPFGLVEVLAAQRRSELAVIGSRARPEPFRGRFAIVATQGNVLTLRERAAETEAVAELHTCAVPHAAASLLRAGDIVDGTWVSIASSRLIIRSAECVYCPAAGL